MQSVDNKEPRSKCYNFCCVFLVISFLLFGFVFGVIVGAEAQYRGYLEIFRENFDDDSVDTRINSPNNDNNMCKSGSKIVDSGEQLCPVCSKVR